MIRKIAYPALGAFLLLGTTTPVAATPAPQHTRAATRSTTPPRTTPSRPARRTGPTRSTRSQPVCNPVRGSRGTLNRRAPSRGQGGGTFGAPRTGGRTHNGIDIRSRPGTGVHSVRPGRVIFSGRGRGGTGNAVVVRHRNGSSSHYYHLQGSHQPRTGTTVRGGQRIGTVGRTGNVPRRADTHLHFELRNSRGRPVEPRLNGRECAPPPRPRGATTAR
ncbi:MAG: M23 family metallopeptidase [Planctomycetes bacterium]|nr:M23 family metallopeptidase [Planctomycetota bacterium]